MTDKATFTFGVLTISDTRAQENDTSGQVIIEKMTQQNHQLKHYIIVPDDVSEIQTALAEMTDLDFIITNGGTGFSKRDVTFEALKSYVGKEIFGFGEIFRMLSYQEIGSHAVASRAQAFFTKNNQLIFALPGSTKACQLALDKLLIKEIPHLIKERQK
ncbi:MAG: MogA/MoaB family molybdenum cofactor biosynthesis protein [Streptococcaceae bacterium]|nr:MogA/MoaB family molybdenum cofactor biosynthesis protein [Streptococcaceae bacterium]